MRTKAKIRVEETATTRVGAVLDHEAYGRVLVLRVLRDGWAEVRDTNGDEWTTTCGPWVRVTCESMLTPNHSDDSLTIWRGSFVPTVMCGYHAQREGIL